MPKSPTDQNTMYGNLLNLKPGITDWCAFLPSIPRENMGCYSIIITLLQNMQNMLFQSETCSLFQWVSQSMYITKKKMKPKVLKQQLQNQNHHHRLHTIRTSWWLYKSKFHLQQTVNNKPMNNNNNNNWIIIIRKIRIIILKIINIIIMDSNSFSGKRYMWDLAS